MKLRRINILNVISVDPNSVTGNVNTTKVGSDLMFRNCLARTPFALHFL
jgi:hypothetical protein